MNDERNKLLTFIAVEWTGNQRVFTNCARNGQELPPPEPRTARTLSGMARVGDEEERGYTGALLSRLEPPTGTNGGNLVPVVAPTETKGPCPLASR